MPDLTYLPVRLSVAPKVFHEPRTGGFFLLEDFRRKHRLLRLGLVCFNT